MSRIGPSLEFTVDHAGMFGFEIGLTFGGLIGLTAVKSVHGLITVLVSWRTEQLLLRYHDALIAKAIQPLDLQKDEA